MLSTATADPGHRAFEPRRGAGAASAPMPPAAHPAAPRRPDRRPLALVAVAAAHAALLVGLAHALRLPVLPPALATLTVQLLGAERAAPAPADLAPSMSRQPPPVWAPPPVVVVAEVSQITTPVATAQPPVATPVALAAPAPQPPVPTVALAATVAPATPPASSPAPRPSSAPAPERQVSIDQVAYLQPPVLAYPLAARRLREQGQVLVRVHVDEAGRPAQAVLQQSSGSRTLDEAALAAVAATRFMPYREGGVPRPFWVVMPLVFSLDA